MWDLADQEPKHNWLKIWYFQKSRFCTSRSMHYIKKGTVRKSFINDESYLMAVELIYTGTILIGVYMKEDLKDKILEQLVKLLHRIDRKYKNPNIIIYGDFNTNSHWTIKKIENKTNLK